MDCAQFRQLLIESDASAGAVPAGAAEHAAACADCRRLVDAFGRLAREIRTPAPGEPAARAALLNRLSAIPLPAPTAGGSRRWSPRVWAAAAAVCAAALTLWLFTTGGPVSPLAEASASEVVRSLLDFNLDLSAAPGDERRLRYDRQVDELRRRSEHADLSPEDRRLVELLLAAAHGTAADEDPLDQADRFNDIADRLLDRLERMGKGTPLHRELQQQYELLAARGIRDNLARASAVDPQDPQRRVRIEQAAGRARRHTVLESLKGRLPAPARKALEEAARKGKR